MGRSSRLVAEDVPLITALHERGIAQSRIASVFGVQPTTIARLLRGWVPAPRAMAEDLARRKALAVERGIKAPPSPTKPSYQRRAHEAVHAAVAVGYLRREPCHCGNRRTQAHHYLGYAPEHRLDVTWLCAQHHKDAHVNHALDPKTVDAG